MIDVVCGAFVKNGKVLIAQRSYGSSCGMFEFPGGKVEADESREAALKREWKEECGIDIQILFPLAESNDIQEYPFHLTCFVCTSSQYPIRSSVHSAYVWTVPEHIYDYSFFEADRILVQKLQEVWPCLREQMKPRY